MKVLAVPFVLMLIVASNTSGASHAGMKKRPVLSKASQECVACHTSTNPGIVAQWKSSSHSKAAIGCYECHRAEAGSADAFEHFGVTISVIVTPRGCARCHQQEDVEFEGSHHAKAGNILASLDNYLAETVEGSRVPFNPHSPGREIELTVNGLASAQAGCQQCHGAKVALKSTDGGTITVDDLKPGPDGKPTVAGVLARIAHDDEGKPIYMPASWPNTGIGRLNLDGSRGSCTACHSRHDFSPRRARQPENCGKCHLGPDHPQAEIYEESKHGIAYRDQRAKMNLGAKSWIVGKDYWQAPTCATCHMSATNTGLKVTHDPGERISWTNRPTISLAMDTDAQKSVITETDAAKRKDLIADSAEQKRDRMKLVCSNCHSASYVSSFYRQYDDFIGLYNEKFAKPGEAIMNELYGQGLLTKKQFDERIEWDWYYLWHHEGRRARHGTAMMAPDYSHWHGMYEVADRFYTSFIPLAQGIARKAAENGKKEQAGKVTALIDSVLARPEHTWYLQQVAAKQEGTKQ